jgi:AcrR family transcriptional regulator
MATLTIADAARVTGVSRMLLYRYIKSGKLSRTPEGLIDTAELLRAGLLLQTSDVTPGVTPLHNVTPPSVTPETAVTSAVTPPVTSAVTPTISAETRTLERLIDVLQRELEAARERETLLLQMLSQMQQQNQRLLDMPRSLPAPPSPRATRQDASGAPQPPRGAQQPPAPPRQPPSHSGDPRGAMRRRIVALLQEHPEGLTPAEIRTLLGVERSLADTCLGMRRYGLVQRVGRGRYVAAPL